MSDVETNNNSSILMSNATISNVTMSNATTIISRCEYSIALPRYVPTLISGSFAVLIGIMVFIQYLVVEKRKEKNYYYHKTAQEENEQEKNDRDAIAFGTNNVSYVVEQSVVNGTPSNKGFGGLKVLEKKIKPMTPFAPPITPFSVNNMKGSRVKTTRKEENRQEVCNVQLVADRMGRGMELVSLVNETDVPVSNLSIEEKANFALDVIRNHLEKMTEDKYVVNGQIQDQNWVYCGYENMLGEIAELRLEIKLNMSVPVNMQVMAFSVKHDHAVETKKFAPTAMGRTGSVKKNDGTGSLELKNKAKSETDLKKLVVKLANSPDIRKLSAEKSIMPTASRNEKKKKQKTPEKGAMKTPGQSSTSSGKMKKKKIKTKDEVTPIASSAGNSAVLQLSQKSKKVVNLEKSVGRKSGSGKKTSPRVNR